MTRKFRPFHARRAAVSARVIGRLVTVDVTVGRYGMRARRRVAEFARSVVSPRAHVAGMQSEARPHHLLTRHAASLCCVDLVTRLGGGPAALRSLLEAKRRQIFSAAPPAPRWGGLYLDLLRVGHIADLAVVQ